MCKIRLRARVQWVHMTNAHVRESLQCEICIYNGMTAWSSLKASVVRNRHLNLLDIGMHDPTLTSLVHYHHCPILLMLSTAAVQTNAPPCCGLPFLNAELHWFGKSTSSKTYQFETRIKKGSYRKAMHSLHKAWPEFICVTYFYFGMKGVTILHRNWEKKYCCSHLFSILSLCLLALMKFGKEFSVL